MPYSADNFDDRVRQLIDSRTDRSYLDIGCGEGKFGKMVRTFKGSRAHLAGYEIDPRHAEQFKLKALYDDLKVEDAMTMVDTKPGYAADFVFIGDCIEHLRKSDGVDLLHYLVYRAQLIVVIFPSRHIQYDWRGHLHEAHRSVWDESDFRQFDHVYAREGFMNFVQISGYPGGQHVKSTHFQ